MLLHHRKSIARIRDGKCLPLLIRVHPAGQVYAETAALKQQKKPTRKKKKKKERSTWTTDTRLSHFSDKSIIIWQATQILYDLRCQRLWSISLLKWKLSNVKQVVSQTDKNRKSLCSLAFKASNLLIRHVNIQLTKKNHYSCELVLVSFW